MKPLEGKRVLVTGGTGSLGQRLTARLLTGEMGTPGKVVVFSRDEAKQHEMRLSYQRRAAATDEVIYQDARKLLEFRIGDVRSFASVAGALRRADVVINAAALKQVPTCEYFPYEAVRTNIEGPENIVRAIEELRLPIETVVGVSTDKACHPVNTMGMTKAIQERVFIQGNLRCDGTRFVCVRYGNVLASRGSVIPLFHQQIKNGGPVTITTPEMTRFLMSLDDAVDTIFAAIRGAAPGDTFVPHAPAARIADVAAALIGDRPIAVRVTGIRPGEKIHETLIGADEAERTALWSRWYAVRPMLPELRGSESVGIGGPYTSEAPLLTRTGVATLLGEHGLLLDSVGLAA